MINPWIIIGIYVIVCVLANLVLWGGAIRYGKNLNNTFGRNPLLPPGWAIGLIWVVIFGFFGYSTYLLLKENSRFTLASISIIVVAVYCILYPVIIHFASRGDVNRNEKVARMVNFIALILAFTLGLLVIRESEVAFLYILPLIVWASYINFADSVYMNFRI